MPFNNTGTAEVDSGTLSLSGAVTQLSLPALTGGNWIAAGTGQLTIQTGNITENDASITLSGTGTFPQINGLNNNKGNLSLLGGDNFTSTAAAGLTNSGTITVGPASTLTVNNAYSHTAAGTLAVQLGGTPGSGQFGQLSANGVTLNGSIAGTLVNGYSRTAGDAFEVVNNRSAGAVSGTFSGLPEGAVVPVSGHAFPITYVGGTGNNDVVLTASNQTAVVGRRLFYSGSLRYDTTGNPQTPLPFSDDNAIASDKSAYLPGSGAAMFVNMSSYNLGINGVMVDLVGPGAHASITLANITNDFTFKVGNNNSPNTWATNTILPTAVMVRAGAGAGGSDRVELIWANNAIQQRWIEVTVLATANTGLAANDVFFFGNEIGNTGNHNSATVATTGTGDIADVVNHGANSKNGLVFINIGAGGPFAPEIVPAATTSDGAIASALASTSSGQLPTLPSIPPWIVSRLGNLDLNHGTIAKYLTRLEHDATAKAKTILSEADQVADMLRLDDSLLDSLLVRLGLE